MDSEQPPPPSDTNGLQALDLNKACRITNVNFEGVHRTRPALLAKIVSDVFTSKSLIDFLQLSLQIRDNLRTLNAFSSVDIKVKPVNESVENEDFEVTFVVKERGRMTASAHTSVDDQSTHLDLQLALPNLNGIGDTIELNSKFNKRFYSGECRFAVPLMPWRHLWAPKYSFSLSQYQWDSTPSRIDQEDKAIVSQIEFLSLPELHHTVSFENIWRFIKSSSSKLTPIEIREQSGHSLKSAIKHSVTWDNRIGGNFPSQGILAKLTNEFTTNLVTGGAKFTRHDAYLQFNSLLLPKYDILCQLNLMAGTLFKPHKINICDKFFAGGPLSLRGFRLHGVGPNIQECPLGDASYLSAGVHLYSILPYTTPETRINEFVRPHLFFNTGTIGDIHDLGRLGSKEDIKREFFRFRDSLRYSGGFGLVMYFMRLRLEVNYCIPLKFKEGDLHMRGVQYGFGLHYT